MNMTPLIDIVFLLIIFFLVSNTMNRQETAMELDLPRAATGREPLASETRRVLLNIPVEGTVLAGTAPITMAELQNLLERQAGADAEKLEVHIRTDRKVPYRAVEPVLLTCAESGVWRVSFSVIPER